MEEGPKRQRASSSVDWSQHSYQIVFTEEEYAIFDMFVMRTLVMGAAHFMMPIGRFSQPDPWPSRRAYIEGGAILPKPFSDGNIVVSFTLNVLDW